MDIFEYLPQLIVAYDGDDEFSNLIHVKKANKDNNYLCPCCGGSVKPRALDSTKEQSHYYHVTGKCTKENQLHFFCKNWLFEKGSKFYIGENLFEVEFIDIEKQYDTPFGKYVPDVTVHTTSGETIYFEMFFSNRKTGDDYFCKWNYLGNSAVEVNIKEYMFKTDEDVIPTFKYLYHDDVCYSKVYEKRDLYANTIARIKRDLTRQNVLNYKARIEQLDYFWQKIRNNDTKESILDTILEMDYEDMVSCYSIIKRKQCVSYLKDDVLKLINDKVISEVRVELGLPYDESIYFDLRRVRGRTYEAGIRLNIKTEHITYNKLFASDGNYGYNFDRLKKFPKIVFSKNIFNKRELIIPDKSIKKLNEIYENVLQFKEKLLKYEKELSDFEKDAYKIKMNNASYTVLIVSGSEVELLFENRYIRPFDIDELSNEIKNKISDNKNKVFLDNLFNSDEYKTFLQDIKSYENIDIRIDIQKYSTRIVNGISFKMYICDSCVYSKDLKRRIDDFIEKKDACKSLIMDFTKTYSIILDVVDRINNCKNNIWKAQFSFDDIGGIVVTVDQKVFIPKRYITFEKVYFCDLCSIDEDFIICHMVDAMHKVMKNMESCGYRIMEARNEK